MESSSINKYKRRYHFSVNFYSLFLIITFVPDVLGVNPAPVKYSYWFIKIILACLVIVKDKRPLFNFSQLEFLYFLLVLLYAVIIFADVFINPEPLLSREDSFIASGVVDGLGFCLGVVIAFSFRYDPLYSSESSFEFFWISLAVALVLAYFLSFESFDLDVVNGRFDANSTINSIMYGQTGCAMALISIIGITNKKALRRRILFILTFILGIISIGKAGSRSPLIVLSLVSMFYFVARVGMFKTMLIVITVCGLIIAFISQIITFLQSIGSSLIPRLTSMIFENDSSGRDGIYANTLNLIKESPILGSYYLIRSGVGAGSYPHNFILEIFMATGIIGGIPFLCLLMITIYRAFIIIKNRHQSTWIVILFLQVIVYGMFSAGLYTSQDFWVLFFFMISMPGSYFKYSFKRKHLWKPSASIGSNVI